MRSWIFLGVLFAATPVLAQDRPIVVVLPPDAPAALEQALRTELQLRGHQLFVARVDSRTPLPPQVVHGALLVVGIGELRLMRLDRDRPEATLGRAPSSAASSPVATAPIRPTSTEAGAASDPRSFALRAASLLDDPPALRDATSTAAAVPPPPPLVSPPPSAAVRADRDAPASSPSPQPVSTTPPNGPEHARRWVVTAMVGATLGAGEDRLASTVGAGLAIAINEALQLELLAEGAYGGPGLAHVALDVLGLGLRAKTDAGELRFGVAPRMALDPMGIALGASAYVGWMFVVTPALRIGPRIGGNIVVRAERQEPAVHGGALAAVALEAAL